MTSMPAECCVSSKRAVNLTPRDMSDTDLSPRSRTPSVSSDAGSVTTSILSNADFSPMTATKGSQKSSRGCPCDVFNPIAGGCFAYMSGCEYYIDSNVEELVILSAGAARVASAQIAQVFDIFTLPEDNEEQFPPSVLLHLPSNRRDLLALVVCSEDDIMEDTTAFCLLMPDHHARCRFVQGMRESCIRAKTLRMQQKARTINEKTCAKRCRMAGMHTQGIDNPHRLLGRSAAMKQSVFRYFLQDVGVREFQLTPALAPPDVVPFLMEYGFPVADYRTWRSDVQIPVVQFRIEQHFEAAGHTWYIILCSIGDVAWLSPRRLAHLRAALHDPIKGALGSSYGMCFEDARFPRGGLRGTTQQLNAWCTALARHIRLGALSPALVALALRFLEIPNSAGFRYSISGAPDSAKSLPVLLGT